MPSNFQTPKRTVFGAGALESCSAALRSLGQKALIVTGKTTVRRPAFALLMRVLGDMETAVFSEIPSEPDDRMVSAGVAVFCEAGCDCIIGIGGGSALDCAKAIAVGAVLPGSVCQYAGQEISVKVPPFALIPTTSGTGSEATRYTVITDARTNAKLLLKGDALLPDLAIVDPAFSVSMPAKLTAYTGMDALTHAIEAYTSKRANPLSDPFAIDAVKRCFESLPVVYNDGNAAADRESMAIAAYEAGVCICNASVTLVHGMSRPIGAKFHVPHGLSNAMLLAPCLAFTASKAPKRFAQLSRAVGFAKDDEPDDAAAALLIDQLQKITAVLEIPSPFAYGIPKDVFYAQAEQMAREALQSGSPANTLCDVAQEDIVNMYHNLY